MMLKKKKIEEEEKPIAPAVKQVVEVVDEEPVTAQAEAQFVEAPQDEKVEAVALQEQQKETVAELFKRPEPIGLPDISIHQETRSKKKILFWIVGGMIIFALIGGGLFFMRGNASFPSFFAAPSLTPTPTPIPTPTPEPQRKDITVEILNGGGVPGAASKMKALLEEKGYTVDNVANAEEYLYDKTEIQIKIGKEAYQKLLMEDLQDTYTLASETGTLSDSVSYDVRVIVGKK